MVSQCACVSNASKRVLARYFSFAHTSLCTCSSVCRPWRSVSPGEDSLRFECSIGVSSSASTVLSCLTRHLSAAVTSVSPSRSNSTFPLRSPFFLCQCFVSSPPAITQSAHVLSQHLFTLLCGVCVLCLRCICCKCLQCWCSIACVYFGKLG